MPKQMPVCQIVKRNVRERRRRKGRTLRQMLKELEKKNPALFAAYRKAAMFGLIRSQSPDLMPKPTDPQIACQVRFTRSGEPS
jgi:hypothetical protein